MTVPSGTHASTTPFFDLRTSYKHNEGLSQEACLSPPLSKPGPGAKSALWYIAHLAPLFFSTAIAIYLPVKLSFVRNHVPSTDDLFFNGANELQLSKAVCPTNGFFDINIKFGMLSFDGAKAIDISWDLIVGRGGQAFIAWISYRLFANALLGIIEQAPVSYELYTSLAFTPTGLDCLWVLLKNIWCTPGWRSRVTLVWLVLASSYMLSFATMASAMTGYTPIALPYFLPPSGNYIKLDQNVPSITFTNGKPLNQSDGVHFTRDGSWYNMKGDPISFDADLTVNCGQTNCESPWDYVLRHAVGSSWNDVSSTTWEGLSSDWNTSNSSWVDRSALRFWKIHICPLKFNNDSIAYTIGGVSALDPLPELSWPNCSMAYVQRSNEIFFDGAMTPLATVFDHENLKCVITQDSGNYQWGLSYNLLTVLLICNAIWTVGMCALWLDSKFCCSLAQRTLGTYRAALDLAESVHANMPDMSSWSEQRIQEAMENLPGDYGVFYEAMEGRSSVHVKLASRRLGERKSGSPLRRVQETKWIISGGRHGKKPVRYYELPVGKAV